VSRCTKQDKVIKGQILPTESVLLDNFPGSSPDIESNDLFGLLETGCSAEDKQSLRDVYNAQAILSNEQNFVLSNYYNIINASPFYDKDLFELCMAVPNITKYGDGIGRAHFREGMKGILPDEVRCRGSKTHIGFHGQEVITRMYSQAESFLMDSKEIWKYVDLRKFSHQVKILRNDKIPHTHKIFTWFNISRTISLAIWLEWLAGLETKKV
jgi:asparagine synthase (glutamine-hydrolysing)